MISISRRKSKYDGSIKTFEMASRKSNVKIIPIVNGKIMILYEEQPNSPVFPCMPGGRVEEEEPLSAAKRELLEETGYETRDCKILFEWFGQSKIYFHESLILARNCRKVADQNLDSGEKISVKFVSFDEFLALVRNPLFRAPVNLKFMIYDALIDNKKRQKLKSIFFNEDE